ncbi:hypothetical protein ABZ897_61795 [Nonomuraea sp. NPDC046802]|uniref:hypothetical protein n=1 Tax=Nonomuraea sp. NPDC046802 TaxID=3154919 RepID=UPI0034111491
MARLSDRPPQPTEYRVHADVWAVPHESPPKDQRSFMAYIVGRFDGNEHEYLIKFTDPGLPAHWARYQRHRYDELELISEV